ncbi:hypothetical protein P4O66_005866 [Electrophorus voltai]|uniref:Uncharacterized protein n=1 Tax=Electrophorus voltai TaxID=2609070 RepID=A0AAD9E351_9TELE|nr:hypothetical protein P4O66_005866 [Electrophorus voltai]
MCPFFTERPGGQQERVDRRGDGTSVPRRKRTHRNLRDKESQTESLLWETRGTWALRRGEERRGEERRGEGWSRGWRVKTNGELEELSGQTLWMCSKATPPLARPYGCAARLLHLWLRLMDVQQGYSTSGYALWMCSKATPPLARPYGCAARLLHLWLGLMDVQQGYSTSG